MSFKKRSFAVVQSCIFFQDGDDCYDTLHNCNEEDDCNGEKDDYQNSVVSVVRIEFSSVGTIMFLCCQDHPNHNSVLPCDDDREDYRETRLQACAS